MITEPKVSVVMACYNSANTLCRSIDSILNQSFNEFEFIIINDGSTDETTKILEDYSLKDERIKIFSNKPNCGLAASLNFGISAAKCDFILRMDADDIAFPERLEKQFSFITAHPEIDILGSAMININSDKKVLGEVSCYENHDDIVKFVFDKPLVFHPTILIRKKIFDLYGYYDRNWRWAEDADLWFRIYDKVVFHNLQEPLLWYTVKNNLSSKVVYNNLKVKWINLRRRNKVIEHLDILVRDFFVMTFKQIKNI